MMDLTNEQFIIILTVVLVILALITILQSIFYQKKKKLQFLLGPSFSLVNIKQSFKEKIKVLYENVPYDDLSSIQVTIRNSGNIPISKEDIIVPIKLNFDEKIRIIDFKKISTKPKGLIFDINKSNDNEVICNFELLNQNYEITLQFVCVGDEIKYPEINATMIKGTYVDIVPYEKYLEEKNDFKNMKYLIFTSFLGVAIIWLSSLIQNPYIILFSLVIGLTLGIFSGFSLLYFSWRGIIKDFYSYLKSNKVK